MAITIQIDNFWQPEGELDSSLFPDTALTMESALIGWLAQASTKVLADSDITSADHNEAAKAWVYYRAYTYIAQWVSVLPAAATVDGMSRTITNDQRAYFANKATEWLDKYSGFSAPTVRTAFFGLAKAGTRHVSYR